MTFAAVGSGYSITGSFSVTPVTAGDLFTCTIVTHSNADYVTGITGSNVTWAQAGTAFLGTNTAYYVTTWLGTVTGTGAANQTVTLNAGSPAISGFVQEFSSTVGSWALDGSQGNLDAHTATCPSLTPAGSGDLYWCYAWEAGTGSSGSTSGYTFGNDAAGNGYCYNVACSSSAQAPVFGNTDTRLGVAVLVRESSTGVNAGLPASSAVPAAPAPTVTVALVMP